MYNLLDEQWLPVLWSNGTYNRVGIRKALTEAHRIRQIAASNPMDRVAVLRFLLALLYWCRGNPPDNVGALARPFPAGWFSKLDENSEYFELLSERTRFYQYRKDGDKKLSANYLIHEVPTGTNSWHFRHSFDGTNGLCPACCAFGLLRLPVFSTSGGKGKSPGINAKPPLYVLPMGNTLAETLWLLWRPLAEALGVPAWEKANIQLPNTGKVPLLTGLTWLPRRVWLDDPEEPESPCTSCGQTQRLIRKIVFSGIGSTKTEGSGRTWYDPHIIYMAAGQKQAMRDQNVKNTISLHASNALSSSEAACSQWIRAVSEMYRQTNIVHQTPVPEPGKNAGVRWWIVGFSTVQNDKYLEAIEWLLDLPSSPTEASLKLLERWDKEGFRFGSKLKNQIRVKESSHREHAEVTPLVDAIRPHVESNISSRIGQLLTGEDEAWQEAANEYQPMMEAAAGSLSPGYNTEALKKRLQISRTLPEMNQRAKPDMATTKRKGGE